MLRTPYETGLSYWPSWPTSHTTSILIITTFALSHCQPSFCSLFCLLFIGPFHELLLSHLIPIIIFCLSFSLRPQVKRFPPSIAYLVLVVDGRCIICLLSAQFTAFESTVVFVNNSELVGDIVVIDRLAWTTWGYSNFRITQEEGRISSWWSVH